MQENEETKELDLEQKSGLRERKAEVGGFRRGSGSSGDARSTAAEAASSFHLNITVNTAR